MKTKSAISTFLITALFGLSAQALEVSDFTQTEYAFGVNEPNKNLSMTPDSLSSQRQEYYNFINFEPGTGEKLIAFLDSPDRALNNESLIIRVRENITKPSKSKITVKLRAVSPEGFGDLKKYKKAEIDIVNGKNKYSVSYDIKYDPDDIDVRKVDVQAVFDRIKKKNSEAWSVVESRLNGLTADKIEQTIVMRALEWEGMVTDISGSVEADFTIWSPYYKRPRKSFMSVSFKGKTKDDNLEKVAQRIENAMKENGVLSDETGSKTVATFEMSPNF